MTYRDLYARKNLYYNPETQKYYKIDLEAKSMSQLRGNKFILKFLFRPVKQKWCFLVEDGLGFYDTLANYKKVKHYGDIE